MKKLKLKENEVVHCRTEKEANKVLKIADKCGKSWKSGTKYLTNISWSTYKKDTCYNINSGCYSFVFAYEEIGYTIITAKEFIKRHKNKSKYKKLRTIDNWRKLK